MRLTVATVNYDRVNDLYNITLSDDTNKVFANLNQLTRDQALTYPIGGQFDMALTPVAP